MARILVVDDNDENVYLLQVLFSGSGHEVFTAKNGAEALAIARAAPPDLAVSDILMPVMDGFALCLEWKKDERLRAVPFVIYTATYTERRDEELAYRLGADRFVIKPQEPAAMLAIVQEALCGSFGEDRPAFAGQGGGAAKGEVLKEYSEALFRKLEKKVADLEAAKGALERTIAERMRAEEALAESEAKYRIVADNT